MLSITSTHSSTLGTKSLRHLLVAFGFSRVSSIVLGEHVAFYPTGGASSHTGHCDGIGHIHTDDRHRHFQSGGGTDTGHQVQVTFMFIAHSNILIKSLHSEAVKNKKVKK